MSVHNSASAILLCTEAYLINMYIIKHKYVCDYNSWVVSMEFNMNDVWLLSMCIDVRQ